MKTHQAAAISIHLNGAPRTVATGTVMDLLRSLDIDPRTVVAELNRSIVRRPDMETTTVHDGDEVELVHFVGGG
jgi:thiazole synthase